MKSSEESKVFEEKRKKDNLKMKLKAIFQECYPGLVDLNGNIKYPINDKLLRKMPILHDIDEIPTRPKMFKVFLYENPEEFEDLLQIWEFASNCLQLPKSFKIEELYAGLKFTDNEEEVTLISEIVWKILEMAIQEIPDEEREDEDSLIWMIKQTISNKLRFVWPWHLFKGGLIRIHTRWRYYRDWSDIEKCHSQEFQLSAYIWSEN